MTSIQTMAGLMLTLCVFCLVASLQGLELEVETTHGRVRGSINGLTKSFKRIPYALPPIGLLRWQPPQPQPSWHPRVLDATQDPPGCPQIHCEHLTPAIACPTNTSEDCLYVNVFVPVEATNTSKIPVMVYIHGGNFFFMSGSSPVYDGEVFVQKGQVILVNIDYRLGALGFLVTGDGELDAKGNYGLYDQTVAMKWVKENIQRFGGDPNKITLFGQSSGAQSVIQHMTSDESSAYFNQVILESPPVALPYKSFDEAFVLGGFFAQQLGCRVADMKCMRTKSAEDIALASWNTRAKISSTKFLELFEPFGPYVDGTYVKGQPLNVFALSQYNKKPIMLGTTTEETVLYVYGYYNKSVSIAEYSATVTAIRANKALQVLNQYPPMPLSGDQREVMVKMGTDLVFGCSNRNLSRIMVEQGEANVWMYIWNHAFSFPGWGAITYCEGRVCHGSEIIYVFATAYKGNFTFTPEEKTLSDDVISYWTNFAKTGDPNQNGQGLGSRNFHHHPRARDDPGQHGIHRMSVHNDNSLTGERPRKVGDLLHWPVYSAATDWPAVVFQTPTNQVVQNHRNDLCTFWDNIGYYG